MKKTNLLAILTLAATPAFLHAQTTNYSGVVGYMKISIPAGKATLVSFPLGSSPIFSGTFSGKSGNSLTNAAAASSLPSILVNGSNEPLYYVEFTSGSKSGQILEILSKNSTTLTLSDASSVSGNESFNIKKFTTISDVFGANNSAGLLGADSVAGADVIWVITQGAWKQYFYYDDGAMGEIDPLQWQTVGSMVNKGDTILDPDQGALIIRKAGSDKSVTLIGEVKSTQSFVPFINGAQIITNPYPVDKTLDTIGLKNGDPTKGLVQGDSISASDVVWKLDNGVWKQYFVYDDGASGEIDPIQWQTVGSMVNQGSVPVAAGEALLVIRKGATFEWNVAPPPVN